MRTAGVTAGRRRLLDAARALFAEKGCSATSVRDIAAACGINSATIYSHFPSKADLFIEIVTPYLDAVERTVDETANNPGSGADRLQRMIAATIEVQKQHRAEYVSLIRDWHRIRRDPELSVIVQRRSDGTAVWLEVLASAIEDGSIRADVEPAEALWLITNVDAGIFNDPFAGPYATSLTESQRLRMLDVVLDGLRSDCCHAS